MTAEQAPDDAGRVYEEVANTITHGLGLALSVVGSLILLILSTLRGDTWQVVSCTIFGVTMVALYAASTLYHSFRNPRHKHILKILDHSAIYLLIAGTYTPFTLISLRGWVGWTLFAVIWTLSIVGIILKCVFIHEFKILSTLVYVVMGWIGIVAIKPLLASVPVAGIVWLIAGGVAYTVGVVFFACKRVPYNHAIWHVFVMAGSICHYFAVMYSVLP
ncbi:MAG TPA: hemolysin III family protein [Blastocatellia bacterium]|nr:hemolysin III family protein [Blastocatellia bacterium]